MGVEKGLRQPAESGVALPKVDFIALWRGSRPAMC